MKVETGLNFCNLKYNKVKLKNLSKLLEERFEFHILFTCSCLLFFLIYLQYINLIIIFFNFDTKLFITYLIDRYLKYRCFFKSNRIICVAITISQIIDYCNY